jgi:hypothetical protein
LAQMRSKAENEFLTNRVASLMQMGLSIDKISSALQIPRATVGKKMQQLRKEAFTRRRSFLESLPLELENSLGALGDLYRMGYTMFLDENLHMSPNSKVNLLSVLKEVINSRVAVLSNVSIIRDIEIFSEHQRKRLELMKKQTMPIIHEEEKTLDEKMAEDGIVINTTSSTAAATTSPNMITSTMSSSSTVFEEQEEEHDDDEEEIKEEDEEVT